MIRPLAAGYRVEVDAVDDATWWALASGFADANLYQVWEHESSRGRFTDTSRLVLKKGDEVVAAAEVRMFRLPPTSRGIAYIRWGPLWRRTAGRDLECFRQAILALKNEYVFRRHMILRMNPRLFVENDQHCVQVLVDEGFSSVADLPTDRTLLMDLTPGLDELRRGLDKKWRNCLSKAEKSGLTLVTSRENDLLDEFMVLYDEMLQRKQFAPSADIQKHRRIQRALPDALKMHVILAREDGQVCAGAIVSALGDTGVYLFGATNDRGMRTSASYAVQWEVLKLLKSSKIKAYDLHGINPETNPGTYHFKSGLAGKNGKEMTFAGQVQAFEASISNYLVLFAERIRRSRRSSRTAGGRSESLAVAPSS